MLGAPDETLFKGKLSTTSIIQEWALYTDIALDGKIIKKDALVELDTGTATVIGSALIIHEEMEVANTP
jgi:pepsin A